MRKTSILAIIRRQFSRRQQVPLQFIPKRAFVNTPIVRDVIRFVNALDRVGFWDMWPAANSEPARVPGQPFPRQVSCGFRGSGVVVPKLDGRTTYVKIPAADVGAILLLWGTLAFGNTPDKEAQSAANAMVQRFADSWNHADGIAYRRKLLPARG